MRSKITLMIVFIGLVACHNAEGGGTTTPSNINNKTISPTASKVAITTDYDGYVVPVVEIYLDELSFKDAFEIQHRAKGEGHTFWWNGEEYTTDLYVEDKWLNVRWVRNADDIDDFCESNQYDECGICDGPGKLLWYKDLDNDGLGNPNIYIKSCTYPSVDEE